MWRGEAGKSQRDTRLALKDAARKKKQRKRTRRDLVTVVVYIKGDICNVQKCF